MLDLKTLHDQMLDEEKARQSNYGADIGWELYQAGLREQAAKEAAYAAEKEAARLAAIERERPFVEARERQAREAEDRKQFAATFGGRTVEAVVMDLVARIEALDQR